VKWNSVVSLASIRSRTVLPGHEIFFPNTSTAYPYVEVDGRRYGSALASKGEKYCYAYVGNRRPVRIERILNVKHKRGQDLGTLELTCVIVRPFLIPEETSVLPWDIWYLLLFYIALILIIRKV